MGRLISPLGALEFEDAGTVVAGIRIEERGRRAHAVTRDTVAVGTVLTIEAVLAAHDVAANWTAGEAEFGLIKPKLRKCDRIVGSAEHRQQNRRDLLLLFGREPLLRGLNHVESVGSVRRFSTSGGQNASRDQQERNVRKPVHRSGLLSKMVRRKR